MTDHRRIKKIHQEIFSIPKTFVYAVLDGASIDNLLLSLDEHDPECFCLYPGDLPHDVEEAAPYIVRLDKENDFIQWVLENGWGEHWGIFAVSREKIKAMRKHFRSFIRVKDPDGNRLFFRYYDPRVLKVYLPTCTQDELETVFGPVLCYMQEGDEPDTLLKFWPEGTKESMIEAVGIG